MTSVLVCVDFINDIVSAEGKLAGKGYHQFVESHGTLATVRAVQSKCRGKGIPVFHIRVGFDPQYLNHPKASPLFGGAPKAGALVLGSWGCEFASGCGPVDDELTFVKPRVSAFFGTAVESALRAAGCGTVLITGVATDLAVQATARDAHDRDFEVVVISDACAAANETDHERSLDTLSKIARVEAAG